MYDFNFQQVITGFIRLQDNDVVSRIPIGLIPLGKTNRYFNRVYKVSNSEARTLGNATMAIIKGKTKQTDVIEIATEGVRPTYCLSGLNWGLLQTVKTKIDAKKHWWAGPWKKQMSFVTRTLRNWPTIFSACFNIDGIDIKSESDILDDDLQSVGGERTENLSKTGLVNASSVNLQIGSIGGKSLLHLQLLEAGISRTDFISSGIRWMKNNYDIVRTDSHRELFGEQLRLSPKMNDVTWFHIDGEEFEAKEIEVRVLKNKLQFFVDPSFLTQ